MDHEYALILIPKYVFSGFKTLYIYISTLKRSPFLADFFKFYTKSPFCFSFENIVRQKNQKEFNLVLPVSPQKFGFWDPEGHVGVLRLIWFLHR